MQPTKPQTVLAYFNSIAARYDVMNSLLSFGMHHLWKRAAIRAAGLQNGDRVLDVCGGTADLALLAARQTGGRPGITVYDFSPEMLLCGKSKASRPGIGGAIAFVCGDAQSIAVRDGSCEKVLIGFGLRNLTDIPAGLREMQRVLKPGGRLVCLEFSRPASGWFRLLYDAYSFTVIPLLGMLITGNKRAYRYLIDSIRAFPAPEELSATMRTAGFSDVSFTRLLNGVAVVHVAIKDERKTEIITRGS